METKVNNISAANVKPPELMSRVEAAAYLGIKPQTLAVWACSRRYRIPVVKIGRLAKYRRSDLEKFITERTVGAL